MLTPHVFIGLVMRLFGPVVVVRTVVLLASGVALLFGRGSGLSLLLKVYKASFILWFGALADALVPSRIGPWLAVSSQ